MNGKEKGTFVQNTTVYLFQVAEMETRGTQFVSIAFLDIDEPVKVLNKPAVILISSDGFRWGYQWKAPTPSLNRLISDGTEAFPGLIPVYPSTTFANHYSIATGLYPAWHGIVANSFRDPDDPSRKTFFRRNDLNPKWWLGEPVWETVVKNGLKAGVFFWPGSQVVKGKWDCPKNFCFTYNASIPYVVRVDTVLSYFDLPPSKRPSFMAMYFETPDDQAHLVGADAPQITEAVVTIDNMLGRLIAGLEKRRVFQDVHIIMVGDHGMVGTCDTKVIYVDDLAPWIKIPNDWIETFSPVLAIRPPAGVDVKQVVKKMKEGLASRKVENGEFLKLYLKEDLSARLHYSSNTRIQPIVGMVSEGYKVVMNKSDTKNCGGAHGYDNCYASMRSIFIGHGPRFRKGKKFPSFENVEIYNVITSILGIKGASNNGSNSFAQSILLPA